MVAVSSSCDALEVVRVPCPSCHGTGESVAVEPSCLYCCAQWTPEHFDAWIEAHDRPRWFHRNRYKWLALPCSHSFDMLTYIAYKCEDCHGVGTVARFQLTESYRARLARTAPRTDYHLARYQQVAPMRATPPLPESRATTRLFDWQRGRYWQR